MMKSIHQRFAIALVGIGVVAGYSALYSGASADEKHPKTPIAISELAKKKGPKPPSGAAYTGTEAHPMVGELKLPIQDAQVFTFSVKTANGATVPVKWSYSPGTGTYLWTTAPIQCEDDKTVAHGGFVMEIHEDGTGSYALGTKQCPLARIYGCSFDADQKEKQCGVCVWAGNDLNCAHD
jgi:hypothetical protein